MIDEVRAKKFVNELAKSCPMLDYQKELMINELVNEHPDYFSRILKMRELNLLYCQYMASILWELLFNKKETNENG